MKKILFFCSFPPPNTGQTVGTKLTFEYVNEFIGAADKINIVDKNRLSRNSGVFSFYQLFNIIPKFYKLFSKIKSNNYNSIYVVYSSTKLALIRDAIYTYIIKKFSKARIIAQLHSGDYGNNFRTGIYKAIFSWLMKKVDVLIFSSKLVNNINNNINASKIVYMANMISPELICTNEEIADKIKKKENDHTLSIYYISNMIKEKGYLDVTYAAAELKKKCPSQSFVLHLIGGWPSDDNQKEFKAGLSEMGLDDNVIIYGAINEREKLKNFFLNADVFVLPTYYPIEAQPFSIIEALNAATPVISTYHASIPELVQNDYNGYLIKPKDITNLCNSLIKLIDKKNWTKLSTNARESYLNNYDREIIGPKLKTIFSN